MYKIRVGLILDRYFDTLEEAVENIYYPNGEQRWSCDDYVIHDVYSNQRVDSAAIEEILRRMRNRLHKRYIERVRKYYGPYEFRNGPVRRTGKRCRRGYYRKPRTKQSLTYTDRELPTSWDDIPRCNQKSWKKHRKTQYKPVAK